MDQTRRSTRVRRHSRCIIFQDCYRPLFVSPHLGGGVSPVGGVSRLGGVSPVGGSAWRGSVWWGGVSRGVVSWGGQSGGGSAGRGVSLGGSASGEGVSLGGVRQDRTTEGVISTRQAVCLLRSRRRTFLFRIISFDTLVSEHLLRSNCLCGHFSPC